MTDEQALIEQARHDPEAFRVLYRRYFPRVYAYVAYRVGRAQDAEDLTAEIFMKVVHGFAGFEDRGAGAFAAWLFRIAHNTVSQFHRQYDQRVEHLPLDDLPDIASEGFAPDQALLRKEQFARLSAMIAALPPRRREVVTLRFFGGLRNNEIAAALGLDERTVAAHLCRALDDLRREVERDEADEREPRPR